MKRPQKLVVTLEIYISKDTSIDEIGRQNLRDHIATSIRATGDRNPIDPLFKGINFVRVGPVWLIDEGKEK